MIKVKNGSVGVSAKKIRPVLPLVRNKPVSLALKNLRFCEKKEIALVLTKLINSGLAIAQASGKYDLDNLKVSFVYADEGPTLKRIMPRAQGRAFRINKRSSYITVGLVEN